MNKLNEEEIREIIEAQDDNRIDNLINILKNSKVSIRRQEDYSFADKISDDIARFAGSWAFIITFLVVLVSWLIFNSISKYKVDPFPFILLNLVLSCVAAIQAPLVLMSQNREEERNKEESDSDFYINIKSELLLEDIHNEIIALRKEQEELKKIVSKIQEKDSQNM